MTRSGWLCGSILKSLLAVALWQQVVYSSLTTSWRPDTYPNPTVDLQKCGRRGLQSWICDPDGVLSYRSANVVEGTLKEIAAAEDPFSSSGCKRISPAAVKGYQVAVALMKKFEMEPGSSPEEAAANFAKSIFDSWGIGNRDCSNGVLLLLSVDDRQVYIQSGKTAAKELTQSQAHNVIAAMKPKLRKGNMDGAIEQGVIDIGLALAGGSLPDPDEEGWDWGVIIFFAAFAGMLGFALWQSYSKRRAQQRCRQLLEKLKREQAVALATSQYPASSCPVCLEDLIVAGDPAHQEVPSAPPAPPELLAASSPAGDARPDTTPLLKRRSSSYSRLERGAHGQAAEAAQQLPGGSRPPQGLRPLVLSCGHTFCESCISRWLDTHNTCPICRVVVAEEAPAAVSPQQQEAALNNRRLWDRGMYQNEFMYRLGSLQRMYPLIVSMDMLSFWHNQVQRGCTVDWPSERHFQLHDQDLRAARAHSGASGAFGGFGGGSSAGGAGAGGSW